MFKDELETITKDIMELRIEREQGLQLLEKNYEQAVYDYAVKYFEHLKTGLKDKFRDGDIEYSLFGKKKVKAMCYFGGDDLYDLLYEVRIKFKNIDFKDMNFKDIRELSVIKDPNASVLTYLKKMCDLEGIKYRYHKTRVGYTDGYAFIAIVKV